MVLPAFHIEAKQIAHLQRKLFLFNRCGQAVFIGSCKICRFVDSAGYKLCRFCSYVGNRCIASDLIRRIAQDLRMGRDIVWKTDEAGERALFAYAVLFDLVLEGAKADPEEFGGLLAVVGDLRQSAPDGFPLDILQG